TSERQPGSSIKPVIYSASFLKGWSPGSFLDDQPTCWQDQPGHQWCPSNFDDKFHGRMTVRSALGNSINIPAVKTLEFVGVPTAVDVGTRLGITTWGADSGKLFSYGRDTPLVVKDRPAASKTGTTDNYRDTWTDGYTPNLAIVVWVGNTDGHPMKQALSSMTAGKIWPEAMQVSFETLGLGA